MQIQSRCVLCKLVLCKCPRRNIYFHFPAGGERRGGREGEPRAVYASLHVTSCNIARRLFTARYDELNCISRRVCINSACYSNRHYKAVPPPGEAEG